MNEIPLKHFLRICFVIVFSALFNSCITSQKAATVSANANVNNSEEDSLPLISKNFLKQEASSYGNCLVRGKNGKKVVALTFDDGPTDLSNRILDVLNKNRVKATFFWL